MAIHNGWFRCGHLCVQFSKNLTFLYDVGEFEGDKMQVKDRREWIQNVPRLSLFLPCNTKRDFFEENKLVL